MKYLHYLYIFISICLCSCSVQQNSGESNTLLQNPRATDSKPSANTGNSVDMKEIAKAVKKAGVGDRAFSHSTYNGKIYYHNNYFLSYSEQDEQAEWVAYEVTYEEVSSNNCAKSTEFFEDPIIETKSAQPYDYKYTGYDKGHMAPSADMRFDPVAQKECYYMSNMSPQLHSFNAGLWNDLENYVRYLARAYNRIYVVTGPVLKGCNNKLTKTFKDGTKQQTRITLPDYYFKIIFDSSYEKNMKMIAFLMPNKDCNDNDIFHYATTVDQVEKLTGIDFFKNLPKDVQHELESKYDEKAWKKIPKK